MIERTFQHIPGVGPWREKDLWSRGILTWDDFLRVSSEDVVLSREGDVIARERIALAKAALERGSVSDLAALIPPREHWRLYGPFRDQSLFLDVEGDGARPQPAITVMGVLNSQGMQSFTEGEDLENAPQVLEASPLWITFNGACFDLQVIRRRWPSLQAPAAHLDLKVLCPKVGLKGGLKNLERQLGLVRSESIAHLGGADAIVLWQQGERDLLREYNRHDTLHLRPLMNETYARLKARWKRPDGA